MATLGSLYFTALLLSGGPFVFAVGPFAIDPYDYYDIQTYPAPSSQEKSIDFFHYALTRKDGGGRVLSTEERPQETSRHHPGFSPRP